MSGSSDSPTPVRVGVTGHMNLTPETVELVRGEIRKVLHELAGHAPLVGVSCIAVGADSIFAEVVLELGGQLEVILPSMAYRATKVKPEHAPTFDRLVGQAATVTTLPFERPGREAYEAANEVLLRSSTTLIAVWDGRSAVDQGGTAAVVAEAEERQLNINRVWPAGASRRST